MLTQQFVLNLQLAVVAHFLFGGGEVAVPKQGHLFLERTRRGQHAVGPPIAQAMCFQARSSQPVQIPVGHLLCFAVALGLDLHAQRFARGFGQIGGRRARHGKGLQASIVRARVLEGRELIRGVLVAHQAFHRLRRRHAGQAFHLLGCAAKSRAFQQMLGPVGVPLRGGQGREVVGPQLGVVVCGLGCAQHEHQTP